MSPRPAAPATRRGLAAAGAVLLLAGWLGACAPRAERETLPAPAVSILYPAVSNRVAQLSLRLLRDVFPDAAVIAPDRVGEELPRCAEEGRVLIIPDSARLPLEGWGPLQEYLDRGGAAVLLGCDPLKARVRLVDGQPQTEAQLFEALAASARDIEGLSSIEAWPHLNNSGTLRGTVRVAKSPALPWPGVSVDVKDFDVWDALVKDALPTGLVGETENAVAFYARGGTETPHLVFECEERDGSHWGCPITVADPWRLFVLHEARFTHFWGGSGRGQPGDRLLLRRVKRMSIGLATQASPRPGDHHYEVSDVRLASDPRPLDQAVSWPDIPLISPPYRACEFRAAEVRFLDEGDRMFIGQTRMQGPLPRPRGTGGEDGAPYRWIPLFAALDDNGQVLGWPASIYVEPQTNGAARKWAWIGLDPTRATQDAIAIMLTECVSRLQRGLFLYKAGVSRFSFEPDSFLQASARWTAPAGASPAVRVAMDLLREDSSMPSRRVVASTPSPSVPVAINLGRAPQVRDRAENYVLRVSLEDAQEPGRVFDRVEQPIKFLPPRPVTTDREWISARGARFIFRGRPLFLLGVNYWPVSANGRTPGEYNPHWLNAGAFDPEFIRRDLSQLEDAGVNAVSLQYHEEDQAPQLKFFVDEARRRGIWVHAFVAGLNPWNPDLEQARRLVGAADLKDTPQVFALDLAWEPRLGGYADRRRFDGDWLNWVTEQYGSVDHAEQVLGQPLPKKDGRLTGPSDDELAADGNHRRGVAVYRRFVDDFAGRRYGQVVRALRRWSVRQLLSARSGYGGSGNPWADRLFPLDLATGAVHFDFTCPEGWGLHSGLEQFYEAGFVTAYARGVSDGKPVLWLEFGASVGADPQPADLANQARVYDGIFAMVTRSRAAGCFGWWFPGGFRVDEKSDFGVVEPTGAWRPVGSVYRTLGGRLRAERSVPDPWRGREVDRAADARGLSALCDAWRDQYRREMEQGAIEEVRPAGFGRRTSEMPLESIGQIPFQDPAPLAYANAEWGRMEVDGVEQDRAPGRKITVPLKRKLRIELINTGPATWDASQQGKAGAVWVAAEQPGGTRQLLPVRSTAFGGRTWVEWMTTDQGVWRLRPSIADVGLFGEPLDLEVAAPAR
ncbi:MAG: hypothetical protein V1873_02215 [Verrucomicrobiota bacterium]